MAVIMTRRHLFGSLLALAAAPVIVRAASLMPIKALPVIDLDGFTAFEYLGGVWKVTYAYGCEFDEQTGLVRVIPSPAEWSCVVPPA